MNFDLKLICLANGIRRIPVAHVDYVPDPTDPDPHRCRCASPDPVPVWGSEECKQCRRLIPRAAR